jgi:SAM-dependent methyltransferase
MSDSGKHKEKQSNLQFQMWDKHLTLLNKIWDLEQPETIPSEQKGAEGQESPERSETHFHTTLWDQHLMTLNQSWAVSSAFTPAPPTSLPGKLLFPLKKLVLRWVQPALDALVQQQNNVTAQIVQTCNSIVKAVNEDAIHTLEAQREFNSKTVQTINSLVELVDSELKNRIDELRTMIWTFDCRKEALEIDEILLNQKLEQVLSLLREQKQQIAEELAHDLPAPGRQDDYKYVLFENRYRGDETAIRERQKTYLQYFQNCSNVLDIGCGRGEFLDLLREHNIAGHGVDMNQTLAHYCRKKNLKVEETDMLSHLQPLEDNSLDGIFTSQTVEHWSPQQLQQFLQLCFDKLQPHKYLVIETQNPVSLYALAHFYRDISHEKPVHPDALEFLVKTVGFQETRIEYKAPFPEEQLLQELKGIDSNNGVNKILQANVETLNRNIHQLNGLLYGYLDYAVIARKIKIF